MVSAAPSGIHRFIFATLIALFILMRSLTTFTLQSVVMDGPAFSICSRIFGIKVGTQKFFFKGVSNLRYEPAFWVSRQQDTIVFEYSSDLGVSHRFGSRLDESNARRVIQFIDEHKSKMEAATH